MDAPQRLVAIDLFAGCGGLSLGLRQAGWGVACAVEISPLAAETYFSNLVAFSKGPGNEFTSHLAKAPADQIRAGLLVGDVRLLDDQIQVLREMLDGRDLELLAGGPPCQGFSLAGRRSSADPRNALVWNFLEIACQLQPRLVLMENVSAIQSPFERGARASVLTDLEEALSQAAPTHGGYSTLLLSLGADHYGVPQSRKRVFLVGIRKDIARAVGISDRGRWDSEQGLEDDAPSCIAPRPTTARAPTSSEALWDIVGAHYAPIEDAPSTVAREYALNARCDGDPLVESVTAGDFRPPNHEFRSHRDTTQARFRLLRLFQEHGIRGKVFRSSSTPEGCMEDRLRPLEPLLPLKFPVGNVDTLEQLAELVRGLPSLKHTQRALDADAPSPTVTTLPDDLCHYSCDRTLTVREMARLQSFPDAFVFKGKATTGGKMRRVEVPQYSQVGNAVPPLLAKALGLKLKEILQQAAP